MKITFEKAFLSGSVCAPASKSLTHRAIIAAALSNKRVRINNIVYSQDVLSTLEAVQALCCNISYASGYVDILPRKLADQCVINCRGSATTLRLLMPICAALGVTTHFYGDATLSNRTFTELANNLIAHGVSVSSLELPVTISGSLQSGDYAIAGNVSSQFISALMLALPLLKGDSTLTLTTQLQSSAYVRLTCDVLKQSKIGVDYDAFTQSNCMKIIGGQQYDFVDSYTIEGDYSNAAFWLVAAAINGNVTVDNLNAQSNQGDRIILQLLRQAGAEVVVRDNAVTVKKASSLQPFEIDVNDIPDLAPALAVLMAFANGQSKLLNTARLKIKESDRQKNICMLLTTMGVSAGVYDEHIVIQGAKHVKGFNFDSAFDHRIAMMSAIAACACQGKSTLTNAQAVNKSYPLFYEHYVQLGGTADAQESNS